MINAITPYSLQVKNNTKNSAITQYSSQASKLSSGITRDVFVKQSNSFSPSFCGREDVILFPIVKNYIQQSWAKDAKFDKNLPKISTLLNQYNNETQETTCGHEKYYDPWELAIFRKICNERNIQRGFKVIGHGDEAIAIEIPGHQMPLNSKKIVEYYKEVCKDEFLQKHLKVLADGQESGVNEEICDMFGKIIAGTILNKIPNSEVLKISRHPLPDFVVEAFKNSTNSYDFEAQDGDSSDIKSYLAPIRDYQEHVVKGYGGRDMVYYSYFQPLLLSKGILNNEVVNVVAPHYWQFSRQLHNETEYTICWPDNAACQYGVMRKPNGLSQILLLDYGILVDKLDCEGDLYYCKEDVLKDMEAAKRARLAAGGEDARFIKW